MIVKKERGVSVLFKAGFVLVWWIAGANFSPEKEQGIHVVSYGPKSICAAEYHVSPDGDDNTGDGSAANPWRTIQHGVNNGIPAQGGDTILAADGTYSGMTTITRSFLERVTIRAANDYAAVLTNVEGGREALRIYVNGSANITVSGFVITNAHPTNTCDGGREQYYLIHIQDASDVTLSNNIIYGANAPGTCNEVVKINRGSDVYMTNVVVKGNVLYDPANAGGADLLDSVRPGELDIVENIFWGNPEKDRSHSFITIKREAPAPANQRNPRYIISRNIFLNWGGKTDQAFLQLGEDGVDEPEITDALVENNLFIGNSPARMAAPMQFKGPRRITVRYNTVVGNVQAGSFGFRVGTEGANPTVQDILIYNNIFSDPSGTMENRFFNAYGDVDLDSIGLDGNLFWNEGNELPQTGAILPSDDPTAIIADPHINADQDNIALPRWNGDTKTFESGTATIRDEFLRLVETYGALGQLSAAIDASEGDAPLDDIRGLARDTSPDIGAYEYSSTQPVPDGGLPPDGTAPATGDGAIGGDASLNGDNGDGPGGCSCKFTSHRFASRSDTRKNAFPLILVLILVLFSFRKNKKACSSHPDLFHPAARQASTSSSPAALCSRTRNRLERVSEH